MPKKSSTKAFIGLESNFGIPATLECRVPVSDMVYIQETPTKSETGIITGRNTQGGLTLDSIDVNVSFSSFLQANKATYRLLQSFFGVVTPKIEISAILAIRYKGTEKSCKMELAANSIKSSIGKLGSEVADTNFGTAGTLTLTGTVTQLIATINGYTDYEAELIEGDGTASAAEIGNIGVDQAKGHDCIVLAKGTSTGIYCSIFKPNYTEGENPSVSVQTEGTGKTEMALGCAVNTFGLSGSLKGKMAMTYALMGTKMNQNTLTLSNIKMSEDDNDPFKFNNGKTVINGKTYYFVKTISVDGNNNYADDEGYSQGGLTKSKLFRGMQGISGSLTITSDDDVEKEKDRVNTDEESSIQLVFTGRELSSSFKAMALVDLATVQYSNYSKSAGSANIETSIDFTCVDFDSYADYAKVYLVHSFSV